jgi:hypothetical protein
MPSVGFEPRISVLEREKAVHALGSAATAIGLWEQQRLKIFEDTALSRIFGLRKGGIVHD